MQVRKLINLVQTCPNWPTIVLIGLNYSKSVDFTFLMHLFIYFVKFLGFDIESDSASSLKEDGTKHTINAVENQVFDLMVAKYWGLKYATDAAATILRVDQIIMAKRAGGPKPRGQGAGPMDDGEDY